MNVGDKVILLPHRNKLPDGTFKDEFATVTNPCDPTDMKSITGKPIGFYVRVRPDGKDKIAGYHLSSLQLV